MSTTSQSHAMSMNKLCLIIVVSVGAILICPPAKANTVYLSEKKFNEKVDRAHAECANVDLDFSNKFRKQILLLKSLFCRGTIIYHYFFNV